MIEDGAHPLTPEPDASGDPAVSDTVSSDGDVGTDRRDPDEDDRNDTPGGIDQEDVEDRPNVGIVEPEDYPEQQ